MIVNEFLDYIDGKTGKVHICPIEPVEQGIPVRPIEDVVPGTPVVPIEFLPVVAEEEGQQLVLYSQECRSSQEIKSNVGIPMFSALTAFNRDIVIQTGGEKNAFKWTGNALVWFDENGAQSSICNFCITILEEKIKIFPKDEKGHENEEVWLLCEILLRGGRKFRQSVLAEKFADFTWIKKATAGRAYLESTVGVKQLFAAYLLTCRDKEVKVLRQYVSNGWKKLPDGSFGYVVDEGVIGRPELYIQGDASKKLLLSTNPLLPLESANRYWKMRKIFSEEYKSAILLALPYLGILSPIFEDAGFPLRFVSGIFGVTNSRKTSVALAMTRFFNREDLSIPDISFESTAGGLEKKLAQTGDAVLVVDDKHPAETVNERNAQNEKFNYILRAYGDRMVKERMTDFSHVKSVFYKPSGVCLVTGEVESGVASTRSRMVSIHIDRESCDLKLLSYWQKNYTIQADHLRDFILYVTPRYQEIIRMITENFQLFRQMEQENFGTGRYAEVMAVCSMLMMILTDFFGSIRMSTTEAETYRNYFLQSMRLILNENDQNLKSSDPGEMVVKAIYAACTSGDCPLIICDGETKEPAYEDVIYGTTEFIFVKLDFAFSLARRHWKRMGKEFPIENAKEIIPFLKAMKVLETQGNRNTRKMTKYVQGQERYLVLKKRRVQEICEEADNL